VLATACAGGPGPALGCNVQAQHDIGSALLFFNVVIFVSGHVAISANVRAETKLGKRRTYRARRNMFLRSSLRFPNVFPNVFPNFSKLFGKIGFGKKFGKKWFSPRTEDGERQFGASNGAVSFQLAQVLCGQDCVPVSLVTYIDGSFIKHGIPLKPIYC
jgi:hypothetical protein